MGNNRYYLLDNGVPVKCYLCGGHDFVRIDSKMRYETIARPWECLGCGLIFLHPPMTPEEEACYYESEYAKIYSAEKGTDIERLTEARRADALMYFNWVKRFIVPGKSCLEVGCASGYFLEFLRRKQYKVAGAEPHIELAGMCRKAGIRVMRSIDDARKRSFDYIFAFFLLEHLGDPLGFLRRASEICRCGGRIFIVVPNAGDVLLSAYDIPAFKNFYFTPAHQFYYTRRTLSGILTRAGLPNHAIGPKQRYDLSNHMHWMMAGKPGGMGKYAGTIGRLANEHYQQNLCDTFLCDTLMAVAEVG